MNENVGDNDGELAGIRKRQPEADANQDRKNGGFGVTLFDLPLGGRSKIKTGSLTPSILIDEVPVEVFEGDNIVTIDTDAHQIDMFIPRNAAKVRMLDGDAARATKISSIQSVQTIL